MSPLEYGAQCMWHTILQWICTRICLTTAYLFNRPSKGNQQILKHSLYIKRLCLTITSSATLYAINDEQLEVSRLCIWIWRLWHQSEVRNYNCQRWRGVSIYPYSLSTSKNFWYPLIHEKMFQCSILELGGGALKIYRF